MGEAYRGLTIRFAADGTKVMSTLKAMSRAANNVESELRLVQRALKFDSASELAAAERMQLLAEKAAASSAKVEKMRRQMAELGKVEFGGVKMEKLAQSTKDASTQASIALERYNNATAALARLHNEASAAWKASAKLGHIKNPFDNWKDMSVGQIQRFITAMETVGSVTKAEAERMRTAVASLRPEFREAEAELKKFNSIAEYQSFGHKIQEEAARAKAATQEFAASIKAMRPTQFTAGIKEARAEVDRLAAQARVLKEAMRADPNSFAAYSQSVETLRAKMRAIETESEKLRAEMESLGRAKGVREAASDMTKLAADAAKARAEVDRLSPEFVETRAHVNSLAERVDELRVKMKEAGNTKLGSEYAAQLQKAEGELSQMRAKLESLTPSMKKAAEHAQTLSKAMRFNEARASIAANTAELTKLEAKLTSVQKTALISSSAFTSMGMQMYSTIYPAVMMGGMYALNAARDIDSAYRDMRKTVQGTEEDFEHLKQAAIEFGDTHFTSADTMLEIESYGGQLGIAVENLEQFGKVVSDLDIATNDLFQTEDIALWLGKMANIMHLNVEEFDNFADSLVRLGNSEPALESDIAAITARFAGMATLVGSTPDEILAIATAATATGQKAEAAGGSLQRTFGRIEGAVAGVSDGMRNLDDMTEEDIEAFEGATDKLQAYADVAGMTAEQFASLWESDATSAFQKFVEGLKRIDDNGGSVDKTLQDLGITAVRDRQLLEGLTNTTDILNDSLIMSKNAFEGKGDQWGDAGDAAREADNKSKGFSGTLQILYNNAQHLAMALADSLVPVLQAITGAVQVLVKWFDQLSPTMQTILTTGIALSAALGPVMTGIGAFGNMARSIKTSWAKATSAEQVMLRTTNSMIPGMAKLGQKYRENAKIVEGYKESAEKLEKVQKNVAAASKTTGANMAVMNAQAKAATETYGKLAPNVQKAQASMQRVSKMSVALQSVGSFVKGIGSAAAFGAAFVAIDRIVAGISDMVEKAETYKQATEGVRAAAERLKNVNTEIENGVANVGKGLSNVGGDWNKYAEQANEAAEKGAAFAKSVNDQVDSMEQNALLADYWGEQVVKLSEAYDGTPQSLAALKTAVSEYNSATGESLTIVDEMSGALSQNTEQIRANTQAYKDAMMVKAFGQVAEDAAKGMAESTVQSQMNVRAIDENKQAMKDYAASAGEAAYATNEYGDYIDSNMQSFQNNIDAAAEAKAKADEQAESYRAVRDAALEQMQAEDEAAKKSREHADEINNAAASAQTYASMLSDGMDGLTRAAETAGYAADDVDSFTASLNEAGITADILGKAGSDAFIELYNSANGNLSAVLEGLNMVNNTGLDAKQLIVTDDGTIKLNLEQLSDIDLVELAKKGFVVSDDGTIQKMENELAALDAIRANPGVYISGGALGELVAIQSKLIAINGMRAAASIAVSLFGSATGNIMPGAIQEIPRHADGGINGIVTRATLTNSGWIGEDGAEAVFQMGGSSAIIPLTNRRYVRPFARAVAGEMDGGARSVDNSVTVVIDNATINSTPEIQAATRDYLMALSRYAEMNHG